LFGQHIERFQHIAVPFNSAFDGLIVEPLFPELRSPDRSSVQAMMSSFAAFAFLAYSEGTMFLEESSARRAKIGGANFSTWVD
jgi:hypothetical protein